MSFKQVRWVLLVMTCRKGAHSSLDRQAWAGGQGKGLLAPSLPAPLLPLLPAPQFDQCMGCVENIDRGEPADFQQACDDAFLLTVGGREGWIAGPVAGRAGAHTAHAFWQLRRGGAQEGLQPSTAGQLANAPSPPWAIPPLICSCAPTSAAPWRTCCARSGRRAAPPATCGSSSTWRRPPVRWRATGLVWAARAGCQTLPSLSPLRARPTASLPACFPPHFHGLQRWRCT